MIRIHGNVQSRGALPHPSYARFVAVLDVLGMKAWLERDSPQQIAETLDQALIACDQSSCGKTGEGVAYGPLIQVFHFSDTLIAWSPDDSWASLGAMSSAIKLIVGVAFTNGVPLRGSISHGDTVCNRTTLKFVGKPIADAYLWAECQRPYKSVGVDFTPRTISMLRAKLTTDPIPAHWRVSIDDRVLSRATTFAGDFLWHADCLFVNHWNHGMFVRANPAEMFLKRHLPIPPEQAKDVEHKLVQVAAFYESHLAEQQKMYEHYLDRSRRDDIPSIIDAFPLQQHDYVQLDALRNARG